jgi:hypothetical protein
MFIRQLCQSWLESFDLEKLKQEIEDILLTIYG